MKVFTYFTIFVSAIPILTLLFYLRIKLLAKELESCRPHRAARDVEVGFSEAPRRARRLPTPTSSVGVPERAYLGDMLQGTSLDAPYVLRSESVDTLPRYEEVVKDKCPGYEGGGRE